MSDRSYCGVMKRLLAVLIATAVVFPASAQAVPYLGFGEASRQIGADLRETFRYGAVRGSLVTDCRRLARNRVSCHISFRDSDYDSWCGKARVRENRAYYRVLRNVSLC